MSFFFFLFFLQAFTCKKFVSWKRKSLFQISHYIPINLHYNMKAKLCLTNADIPQLVTVNPEFFLSSSPHENSVLWLLDSSFITSYRAESSKEKKCRGEIRRNSSFCLLTSIYCWTRYWFHFPLQKFVYSYRWDWSTYTSCVL